MSDDESKGAGAAAGTDSQAYIKFKEALKAKGKDVNKFQLLSNEAFEKLMNKYGVDVDDQGDVIDDFRKHFPLPTNTDPPKSIKRVLVNATKEEQKDAEPAAKKRRPLCPPSCASVGTGSLIEHVVQCHGVETKVDRSLCQDDVRSASVLWKRAMETLDAHGRALVVSAPNSTVDGVIQLAEESFGSAGIVLLTLGDVFHAVQFCKGGRTHTVHVHENAWGWTPHMCEVMEATIGAGQALTIVRGVGAKDRALLSWGLFTAPKGLVFQDTLRVHTEEPQWKYEVKTK